MTNDLKVCGDCNEPKPLASFSRGHRACRPCAATRARLARAADPVGRRERERASELRIQYGMTPEDFERIKTMQDGVCRICGEPETYTLPDGRVSELSVDHCHGSKVVRGLLCRRCNRGIAHLSDDPARLRAAADYLEAYL